MLDKLLQLDKDLFIYLNNLGIESYDTFWVATTNFTTWIPLYLLFILLIIIKYPKREGVFALLTLIAMLIFVAFAIEITKISVARLRPNNTEEIQHLIRILQTPSNYSFFSGHAASSFAMTTLVVLFVKDRFKIAWLLFMWPIIFTLSRIYVGVHYPADLITGATVGLMSALLFFRCYTKLIAPYLGLNHL